MKLHVSLIVLYLLQLGVTGDESEINGVHVTESIEDITSEESDRELRPMPYPGRPQRPGQSQKYGLNSLLGFRPFRNPNSVTNTQSQGLRGPARFNTGFRGNGGSPNDVNGDGQPDGALILGIPRQPNSLAERLGFFRINPGTNVFFVEGPASPIRDNIDFNPPTTPPEPTISPRPTTTQTSIPTAEPTINPTRKPTQNPTHRPTFTPTLPPTRAPTNLPTKAPTKVPTSKPTKRPTAQPSKSPTKFPTSKPTKAPTKRPTLAPTKAPVGRR